MKKLLLFIFFGVLISSCVTTRPPTTKVIVKPTYKRFWWKPWYGPRYYVKHPQKRRHH